ncbi:MAG: DUF4382 domain-containing protein [Sulfuricaulis sp.]|uniref:DUF4382 domain-containing protein n=1 Tax=Sulfuricaulis sp. TaxID=2003553 RepID=UPI003C494FA3
MTQDHSLLSARAAGFSHRWRQGLLGALLLFTGAFLAACGSGGGSDSTSSDSGVVYVGLTDADGDFITYSVDITALTLTRADGAVVDALPVKTRVDFAQYTDMTEFLNAATVPSGVYTRVDMTLDYTNADIRVASGSNALLVSPKDTSGNPITTMTLQVKLDGNKPLVVRPGIPAHLTLDFDLEATNTVDLNAATVTVSPLLLADVDLATPKVHRVRGPLVSVDPTASEFVVAVRPFHRLIGDFGRLTVKTDNATMYEIDGDAYQGAAGLTQLDGKPQGTATVAVGNFNVATHSFLATEVYAGSSVAFGTKDVVTGSVIARSGSSLTVRGAALVRTDGTLLFNDTVSVTLDSSTKVARQLGGAVTTDDISVGSRITALGTLTGSTLDTTNGLVRIVLSTVTGSVNLTGTNQITVNLQTINGRPVTIYSFTGTGSGGSGDSNPTAYRINTTGLSLANLTTNDPVRVRGFVVAYGQVVTNDFNAQTVIDLSDVPAWMAVAWMMPQPNPFSSLTNQAMVTDITGSWLHHMFQRGVATTLTGNPTVQPDEVGQYAIVRGHTVQLYGSFDSFSNGLTAELAAAHRVWGVGARGKWDNNSVTLTSRLAVVKLQ